MQSDQILQEKKYVITQRKEKTVAIQFFIAKSIQTLHIAY